MNIINVLMVEELIFYEDVLDRLNLCPGHLYCKTSDWMIAFDISPSQFFPS